LKISREFFMGGLWEGFWESYGRVTGYTVYHRPVAFLGQLQYNPGWRTISMPRLKLYLFGPPRLERDGVPLEFGRRKGVALLSYLAMTKQHHSRDALAALFWPDLDQSRARAALRRDLSALNKALDADWLEIGQDIVGLKSEADFWLDVDHFHRSLAACQTHDHPIDEICSACLPLLTEAADLYHDHFLAGFTLRDSPDFDEWQFFQTEDLRQSLAGVLERLVRGHRAQAEFEEAIRYARRWLALDPLHEPAHRQLMQLYAETDQHAAALRQYQLCLQTFEDELGVPPSEETTQLYEQIRTGDLSKGAEAAGSRGDVALSSAHPRTPTPLYPGPSVPRPSMSPTLRHSLSSQPTTFIGRETELAKIANRLGDPGCRLLTLAGPGGIGKTRLAIEAADTQSDTFSHGVTFVPLASVNPVDFEDSINPLVAVLADALNFAFRGGRTPIVQLLNYLQDKEMLIILDDFEQFLADTDSPNAYGFETVDVVAQILESAPLIKVMVTSRARLNLQEEWLFSLQGMTFPIEEMPQDLTEVEDYSAVQLFLHHARRVQADFDLVAEMSGIVRICRLVEGLPLGIELAAAWVRQMPCELIAREIEQNIDFLTTNLRNVPERHRSLRAVCEHSWRLLSETERDVLLKLSVFRGGFQREAAEEVAGASLLLLSSLLDKSLLQVTAAGRYSMHDLLRHYVAEKLQSVPGGKEKGRAQHGRYYTTFLRQHEPHLKGERIKEALVAVTMDIDNVRTAWRWAVEQGQLVEIKGALESLWLFYEIKGWFLEGEEMTSRTVARLKDQWAMPENFEGSPLAIEVCPILGQALAYQAWFCVRLGLLERAKELIQESLLILQQMGARSQREIAIAWLVFGFTKYMQGLFTEANQPFQESRLLFEQIDDPWGRGTCLSLLAHSAYMLGRYKKAEQFSQESIAILRNIGDLRAPIFAISLLGRIAMAQGQYEQAEEFHQECFKRRQELQDRTGIAFSLRDLGDVVRLQGQHTRAEQYYQESLAMVQEINLQQEKIYSLLGLGKLAQTSEDYTQAKQFFQESLAIHTEIGVRSEIPEAFVGLGWATYGLGDYQEAKQYFHAALKVVTESREIPVALDALAGLATLLAKTGDLEGSLELLMLALHHPACSQETKDRLANLRVELAAELPPEVVAAAEARGKGRTLERMEEKITTPVSLAHP
jgi:DNA-binding SARP family transcriptional activator/predicted ATPase